MAETDSAFQKFGGKLYLKVTPGRAQIIVEALDLALASGQLDKRIKGTVTTHRELFALAASGKAVEKNPPGFVYVLKDGPLTKIGHTRNIDQRLARQTDRPTPLIFVAAWSFASVQEAMAHEAAARSMFKPYQGGGGTEWVETDAGEVLAALVAAWGKPHRSNLL